MVQNFLRRHPLLRRAVLLLVIFYCFHGAVLELRASRQYRQVAKWPMTQAFISSSAVYWTSYSWSGKHNRNCPKLNYKYTLQTRIYDGTGCLISSVGLTLTTSWPNINRVRQSPSHTTQLTQPSASFLPRYETPLPILDCFDSIASPDNVRNKVRLNRSVDLECLPSLATRDRPEPLITPLTLEPS